MFSRLVYDLLPSGEWWDTIPADIDRWGARKFTIGPNGSRLKGPMVSIFFLGWCSFKPLFRALNTQVTMPGGTIR
eukprot:scaffold36558_cov85-Phaeocystis_antarctica.AAC.3